MYVMHLYSSFLSLSMSLILFHLNHFISCNSSFFAFMAVFTAQPVQGLLYSIYGQYPKNGGHRQVQIQMQYTVSYHTAYIVEMRGFATYHASQCNIGMWLIHLFFSLCPVFVDGKRNFHTAGNYDGFHTCIVLLQYL